MHKTFKGHHIFFHEEKIFDFKLSNGKIFGIELLIFDWAIGFKVGMLNPKSESFSLKLYII